jgi:molybdenum cofactor cytidylyltransferase
MALNKKIVDISRELRKNQTETENQLWQWVRNRKLKGFKFLRQHPIVHGHKNGKPLFFIADFYCHDNKFVIEIDGKIHDFQKDYDENREEILRALGLSGLRIKNEEFVDITKVLKKIVEFPTRPPSPSLQGREGAIERSEIGGELKIAILILAAGSSSRLGQSKQLLEINGEPLLLHSAKTALQSKANKVLVVLGSEREKHDAILKGLPIEIHYNKDWKKGMGNSLKAGISNLTSFDINAVIIMVCDQPLLSSLHLNTIIKKYLSSGAPLIASRYADTDGVPALFDKSLFSELLRLEDEQGAKKIINKYKTSLLSIDFPDGEIDLDTAEDYANFQKRINKQL